MKTTDPRDILKNILLKTVIGPANDTFLDAGETELASDYPLEKYFSAILFPKDSNSSMADDSLQMEINLQESEIEKAEDDIFSNEIQDSESNKIDTEERDTYNDDFTRPELFPYTFGLSFCVDAKATEITIQVSFGSYRKIDPSVELHENCKIPLSYEDYNLIKAFNTGSEDYLGNVIGYDKKYQAVFLKRIVVKTKHPEQNGDQQRISILKRIAAERFRKSEKEEKNRYYNILSILRKITPLFRNSWVRTQHVFVHTVKLENLTDEGIVISSGTIEETNIKYKLHLILTQETESHRIIKATLENASDVNLLDNTLARKPIYNTICMFQSKMQVQSSDLIPMPKPPLSTHATLEDKIIDCQYRASSVFAISHNCACSWDTTSLKPNYVETEFMPSVTPPVTSNNLQNEFKEALNIKQNSCFGTRSNEDIINHLNNFACSYGQWIDKEVLKAKTLDGRYEEAAKNIICNQEIALKRLRKGIDILNSPEYMNLYRIANSAMLVNMRKPGIINAETNIDEGGHYYYYPFQLAFLLINLESITNPDSDLRKQSMDLLWFPTGGGKTEAYFLLTAFSLLFRRYKYGSRGLGTSVIMRYTLRLLTSQQFERASRMILSLNYVCSLFAPTLIAESLFSIGLWIGASSSPNSLNKGDFSANTVNAEIIEAQSLDEAQSKNEFPVSECPWCGSSLVDVGRSAFNVLANQLQIMCLNKECIFHKRLPIDFVDESLYKNPPTLLFATVDKFARLAWVDEAAAFFGANADVLPPDIIIQDELHLISGPLGSITGLFETIVEMLCQKDGHVPRIIASTATIKNSEQQVKGLFDNRSVFTFPAPGLDCDDSFFAKTDFKNLNREYVGVLPTGKSITTTQINLMALLLSGRHKLAEAKNLDIDNYWTIVAYYNSLRELGRMYSKARDEVLQTFKMLMQKSNPDSKHNNLMPPKELTSRISGIEVKRVLGSLEKRCIRNNDLSTKGYEATDIVFATNMISVGLDIDRLNVMLVNGQPKSIAEYIQVTSRIARSVPGLIVTLFNPFKVRDKSHFENFSKFHREYYRYVEPISVTPFTLVTIQKMMPTLMAAYLRIYKQTTSPKDVTPESFYELMEYLKQRVKDDSIVRFIKNRIDDHCDYLSKKLRLNPGLLFADLLQNTSDAALMDIDSDDWLTMNSMREISPNAVIKILSAHKKKKRTSAYDKLL